MYQFKLVSCIVLMLCFSKGSEGFRINQSSYSVVEKLGNSCPASESCEYRRSMSSDPEAVQNGYNCACDDRCSEYDDCCIDGPRRPLERNQMKCLEVEDQEGVYMIDSCPKDYNGSEIVRQLCDLIYLRYQPNPVLATPITDFSKGITYKNVLCARCNENIENLSRETWNESFAYWPPKWDCSHQPHQVKNSAKGSVRERWSGRRLDYLLIMQNHFWPQVNDSTTYKIYEGCEIVSPLPSRLQNEVRRCRPNLVSDCPPSWKDEYVRSMCKSYTGARFDLEAEGRGYKNAHCAICNGVDATGLSCMPLKRTDTYRYSRNDSNEEIEAVKEKIKQCLKIDRKNIYCV